VQSEPFLVEGVSVQTFTLEEASTRICDDVSSGKAFSVFTLNLDHVVKLRSDPAFRAAYDRARVVLADGFPIVLSGRLQGRKVERTTGADLIEPLCREASRRELPVMLFGSTFETLSGAARHLKARYPDLVIAGVYAPEHGLDVLSDQANEGIDFIRSSGARVCFVALGAPKQEIFADRCAAEIEGVSFICVGAGLDFLAGHQRRAPKFFQATGLEWLWRMLNNPRRLARRYLDCLYVFPGVLLEGLSRR
jgi:N-acetylglucosaminyldiphosphoundecaprenol N-acetyl-beta-D-mannosaminyltransferase